MQNANAELDDIGCNAKKGEEEVVYTWFMLLALKCM